MLQASCNSVDEAGSSPLHLAAWAGHGELVRVLLETGPSVPNVNLTNGDKETSLHCAAQVTNQNTAADHVTTSSPLIGAAGAGPRGLGRGRGGGGVLAGLHTADAVISCSVFEIHPPLHRSSSIYTTSYNLHSVFLSHCVAPRCDP